MSGSFCEYANGEFDQEWDEFLDWLGLWDCPLNAANLELWLENKLDSDPPLPTRAAVMMRDYVREQEGKS